MSSSLQNKKKVNYRYTFGLPQGNEFFARVTFRVLHQKLSPKQAIEQVAGESSKFIQDKVCSQILIYGILCSQLHASVIKLFCHISPPTSPPSHPPTHPPSHPPTRPPIRPPTHPPTHAPTHAPTHPRTHPRTQVKQALLKVKEATDPSSDLYKEEFTDDLALTSMARLWDVGRTEPIKVGKASPTTGTLPGWGER